MNQKITTIEQPKLPAEPTNLLSLIREITSAPDADQRVATLRELLAIRREEEQREAERELDEALASLDIPIVKKNGKIPLKDKDGNEREVSFAKWPDIYRILKPILKEHHLGISFTAPKRSIDGGGSDMKGRVFRKGAFREAEISLPLDTGPGRNNIQALGSSISYGKKYLTFMLLNVATEDEDDDGAGLKDFISTEEAAEVDLLLRETGADREKFLKWIGAPDVQSILRKNLPKALAQLKKKQEKKA